MSRSIQSRGNYRQGIRLAQVRPRRKRDRGILTAQRSGHSTTRVIGLPLDVTFPRLKGTRWQYCTRWDEGPAAVLGMTFSGWEFAAPVTGRVAPWTSSNAVSGGFFLRTAPLM
jgi:hypothetical protein